MNFFICNPIVILHLSFLILALYGYSAYSLKDRDILVPVKVVNEIAQIDNSFRDGQYEESKRFTPKYNLFPSQLSGPSHLQELIDSCFFFSDNEYKYTFCPFSNVTQEELNPVYESSKVVLGVWGEWIIQNNSFTAMHFLKGNPCAQDTKRNIKIDLNCGKRHSLVSIKEPEKCNYQGIFETPLVCGNNSLVVYPRLPTHLQKKWDTIATEKSHNILTEKGYQKELNAIFLTAGYLLSDKDKAKLYIQEEILPCEKSLEVLRLKVKKLEEELEIKNVRLKYLIEAAVGNRSKVVP